MVCSGKKEFTLTALVLGVVLAVVFGAANAYLGLRVGLTVSASVPAAVISMGVLRFVLRRDSILENNMVQTIGSAGGIHGAGTSLGHAHRAHRRHDGRLFTTHQHPLRGGFDPPNNHFIA